MQLLVLTKHGAVGVDERALDAGVDAELMLELAGLYVSRGIENDTQHAANLYAALGDALEEEGAEHLRAALDLAPDPGAALGALDQLLHNDEQPRELGARWIAYVETSSDSAGVAERRVSLGRALGAEGRYEDALGWIAPLVDQGDRTATMMRDAFLDSG